MENKHQAKQKLDEIKYLLKRGEITYDVAKEMAVEPLKEMNEKMEKIAKEFGRKAHKVTFAGFMR